MPALLFLLPPAITGLSFIAARFAGWVVHADASLPDADAMWAMGLRFDLKLLVVLWLLPWLAAQLTWHFRPSALPALLRFVGRFFLAQLILFNFLAVSNFLYHGYYHTPFNPQVFGLIDDDTWVVLVTIWHDLPLLRAILVIALASWLQWRLWRYVETRLRPPASPPRGRQAALFVTLVSFALLVFLARGRLDAQPINREDFSVSPNATLCDLVPNAGFALYYAWKDYRTQTVLGADPTEGLRAAGYASPAAAAAKLGIAARNEADILAALLRTTPDNPVVKQRPPHVVIVLFESWGAQALQRHAADNDLLGRFAKHLREDYWFPRFTSSRRGTHPSMESLLINTPITPLSQGRYGEIDYLSAAARPFQDAGYRTIFMYGGSARWRSMHRAMPHLGFDEVLDLADIQKRFPDASTTDNGAHDEFLYRLAEARLRELDAEGKPAMLFILNTSNHTPYVREIMPATYTPTKIDRSRFADAVLPPEVTEVALQGFRYATDQLGAFVDTVAASPLGERTLFAATGDHYLRNFFRLDGDADTGWLDRVGFFLRVPPAYRSGSEFAPDEFGSHRDIFPTLYHRALSGARYFAFGEDLLAPGRKERGGVAVADFSNVYRGNEVALRMNTPTYFRWDANGERLLGSKDPSPALRAAVERERALAALQDWVIRLQVTGQLNALPATSGLLRR